MPILYIDCAQSGLSGDIMVSLLHELGVPAENFQAITTALKKHLEGLEEFSISFVKLPCNGIQVSLLKMELREHKHHRSVSSLEKALKMACTELNLSPRAYQLAGKIFACIVEVESKIHNIQPKAVHLHELASADTLFDAIGVAMGLHALSLLDAGVKVFASNVAVGGGSVKIAHGMVTVPAPATAEIMKRTNLILQGGPIDKELLTPTGAAILAALEVTPVKFLPPMKVIKIGRGAGNLAKEGLTCPVVGYLGEGDIHQEGAKEVVLLETNLDDVPGEYIGHTLEQALEAGALDAYISPILMKKSRPANILHVLCNPSEVPKFLEIIFAGTGTLGVRILEHYRMCLPREIQVIRVNFNDKDYEVHIKVAHTEGNSFGFKPEYEDLIKISKETKIPVPQLAKAINAEFLKQYSPNK